MYASAKLRQLSTLTVSIEGSPLQHQNGSIYQPDTSATTGAYDENHSNF